MTKIALVTGGSRGLGNDMAFSLARKGIDVIITYRENKEQAEQTVVELGKLNRKAAALQLDISVTGSIDQFISNVKTILKSTFSTNKFDYLVNNAGSGATLQMKDVTEASFDKLLNEHFKGVYFLTQNSLPIMNDHGAIVFISSGTTRFTVPGYSVYASLKGAVEVLARYVAKEQGPRGIRANIVAPGPIETDFNNAAIRSNPQLKSFLASQTALGRVGEPNDVGNVVAFLCTDEARWVNGQRIEVSGGINL